MPRTVGSKNYFRYRPITVEAGISDEALNDVLTEQAKERFNLQQAILHIPLGLRLIFVKKTK